MKGMPFIRLFGADWRSDPKLRLCSLAARGLWIELCLLMHEEGEPYGHLLIHGEQPTVDELAGLVGVPVKGLKVAMAELDRRGVCSKTEDGTVYSRRMVRDEEIRVRRAEGGKEGGNPSLAKRRKVNLRSGSKDNLPSRSKPPLDPKHSRERASAQALDSGLWLLASGIEVEIPQQLRVEEFVTAWGEWCEYRSGDKHQPVTARSAKMQLTALAAIGPDRATEALNESIRNGWQGVFPDRQANGQRAKIRENPGFDQERRDQLRAIGKGEE